MFGPMPESNTPMEATTREANKKRKGMKNPTVHERDSKLVMALARLALQHESERRAHARDDNVVFSMPSSGELAKELQWAADKYAETGCSAQERTRRELQGSSQRQETRRDVCLPAVPHAPGHPDESRRRQYYSSGALCGEQRALGNEPESSGTSDLASGGGTSKPTRSSSCHEVLCRPVQERRNNEVDCSGQRGHRAEHGFTSMQIDATAQEHRSGESDGPRSTVTSGKRRWCVGLWTGAEQSKKTEAHEKVRK